MTDLLTGSQLSRFVMSCGHLVIIVKIVSILWRAPSWLNLAVRRTCNRNSVSAVTYVNMPQFSNVSASNVSLYRPALYSLLVCLYWKPNSSPVAQIHIRRVIFDVYVDNFYGCVSNTRKSFSYSLYYPYYIGLCANDIVSYKGTVYRNRLHLVYRNNITWSSTP